MEPWSIINEDLRLNLDLTGINGYTVQRKNYTDISYVWQCEMRIAEFLEEGIWVLWLDYS